MRGEYEENGEISFNDIYEELCGEKCGRDGKKCGENGERCDELCGEV